MFGNASRKIVFDAALSEQEVTTYGNVVKERDNVAHVQGSTVTLNEIKAGIAVAKKMLSALEEALA
jgi:hypothetical protein